MHIISFLPESISLINSPIKMPVFKFLSISARFCIPITVNKLYNIIGEPEESGLVGIL